MFNYLGKSKRVMYIFPCINGVSNQIHVDSQGFKSALRIFIKNIKQKPLVIYDFLITIQ